MNTYLRNKLYKKNEKGQILVIFVFAFIGLIAIIGLAVDLGNVFVSYSRLSRGVDAAALAATSQFREGYTVANLVREAQQFLDLNGINDTTSIQIESCENAVIAGDPELCTTPTPKKIVRVTVSQNVQLFFLPVVGIRSIPITVSAISEAASVDLVLLIDTSSSMAQNVDGSEADPNACNLDDPGGVDGYPGECHPLEEIKEAAILLVDHLFLGSGGNPGYDRVAIVTYDRFPVVQLEMTDDQVLIENTIKNLTVYAGERQCPFEPGFATMPDGEGPCRSYNTDGSYWGLWSRDMDMHGDPRGWMVTNSGGGLKVAGNLLGGLYPAPFPRTTPVSRQEALWVVVWLTDGFTNAGFVSDGVVYPQNIGNAGMPYCPEYTWEPLPGYDNVRYCVDQDARDPQGRHNNPVDPLTYDPDDYARDQIDFVTDPIDGQGALMFTIGQGTKITETSPYEVDNGLPAPGETLLQYGADQGGGVYYAVPDADQLNEVFLAIANKIATRLSR